VRGARNGCHAARDQKGPGKGPEYGHMLTFFPARGRVSCLRKPQGDPM
jgi:hypothetical protein